jgi:hypothetical protein
MAGIALAHRRNANLVLKWRRMATAPSARKAVQSRMPARSFMLRGVSCQLASVGELVIERSQLDLNFLCGLSNA